MLQNVMIAKLGAAVGQVGRVDVWWIVQLLTTPTYRGLHWFQVVAVTLGMPLSTPYSFTQASAFIFPHALHPRPVLFSLRIVTPRP